MESRIRLIAAAGHDLRTPMTRLRLRAELLPDDERYQWLNDLEELDGPITALWTIWPGLE